MNRERFLEIARVLPEPTLLLTGTGQILASNPAVTALLGFRGQELSQKILFELITNSPDRVYKYLVACSRTREFVLGSFTFRAHDRQDIVCRCEGAVIRPGSPKAATLLLLRVYPQPKEDNRFLLLNREISELNKQLRVRWRLEEALRRAHEGLEQKIQERTQELVRANEALQAEIIERQRAEQKLIESERLIAIGTATAKIVHEIGNPLNGIYTTVQLLERFATRQKNSADDVSTIQDLKREISRLNALLQELRSFSRSQQLTLQPTNLTALMAEVLAIETPSYTECGIHVEQDFSSELPETLTDPEKLKQVILNLCKNAVEAMPESGTLTVRGYRTGDQVCLEVQDTGGGIPEGVEIFDLFTTTKPDGTGLGLPIVRQIVLAHVGTLTYTSTPGQGTTFTVTLPVHPQGAAQTGSSMC
jgi:signal transduction histidine kinase